MFGDVEPDNEVTEHRPLEADAEEQPPFRVPTTRREERPPCLDMAAWLALEHASKVEHIPPALRLDPESATVRPCSGSPWETTAETHGALRASSSVGDSAASASAE